MKERSRIEIIAVGFLRSIRSILAAPRPLLHHLLAGDCLANVTELLEVDEPRGTISPREAFGVSRLVLGNPASRDRW